MIAQVVPALALPRRSTVFDYRVPAGLAPTLRTGHVVLVPFRRRTVPGVVWSLTTHSQIPESKLRSLEATADAPVVWRTAQRTLVDWLACRAGVAPGMIIKSALATRSDAGGWPDWPQPTPTGFSIQTIAYDREAQGRNILTALTRTLPAPIGLVVPSLDDRARLLPLLPTDAVVARADATVAERRTTRGRLARARVIIGTRSLFTTPLPPLGALIVWHEGNALLDQRDQQPRFSAWSLARRWAELEACPLIALSPAPSLAAFADARKTKTWEHRAATDSARLVLWPSTRPRTRRILTHDLLLRVAASVADGQRVLLLINRRGVAHRLRCLDCGWLARCERCQAALVLHRTQLRCHACGFTRPAPAVCPHCSSRHFATALPGTAALETELTARFPGAIQRLDRDAPPRLTRAPILVATEFALPRLAALKPAHVIVLGFDAAFAAPDVAGLERAHRLIRTLLAADSVRSVAIETSHASHPLFRALAANDPAAFWADEWRVRERLGFPPARTAITFESRTAQADVRGLERWLAEARVDRSALEGPLSARRGRRSVVRYRLRGPAAAAAETALTGVPESWIIDPDSAD